MEHIFLVLYNFIFFWKFYKNPHLLSTSELLEIHYSHWIWLGRKITSFRNFFKDDIYYLYPACMPHLSTFYPWHFLSSILSRFLSRDNSFKLLVLGELTHYILSSILSFIMFSQWASHPIALFGSITLTYMAYSMKLIRSYIVYTMAWIPGMFIQGWLGWFSVGMAILSGGYPILIYILPMAVFLNPICLFGVLIGSPQLLFFIWYFPKSIKSNFSFDQKFGRVPLWCFIDFLVPCLKGYINRVGFPEFSMYLGVAFIFILFSTSRAWIPLILCFLGMIGVLPVPFRVPARLLYPFCFCIIWMACNGLTHLGFSDATIYSLTFLQCFLLFKNIDINTFFPLAQWPRKISEHEKNYERYSFKFPFRTGYYFEEKTKGYGGGLSLRSVAKKLGVTDLNGEPSYY